MLNLSVVMGSLELGVIYAILGLGIFTSFRVLNAPDLTVDGSFTSGVAVSTVLSSVGLPYVGIVMSIVFGMVAGAITGLLQTKLKIQPILAGILTMTGIYSINLRIMGKKPTISLYGKETIFTLVDNARLLVATIILAICFYLLYFFLKSQLGMSLRATGDNEKMVKSSSINADSMKILGLAIANGLVGLSGGILGQYQNFGDINSGTGIMVIGLASIIIGEALVGKKTVLINMVAAVIGAIIYRFIIAIALQLGLEAIDLKLLSTIIVVTAITIPKLGFKIGEKKIGVVKC